MGGKEALISVYFEPRNSLVGADLLPLYATRHAEVQSPTSEKDARLQLFVVLFFGQVVEEAYRQAESLLWSHHHLLVHLPIQRHAAEFPVRRIHRFHIVSGVLLMLARLIWNADNRDPIVHRWLPEQFHVTAGSSHHLSP